MDTDTAILLMTRAYESLAMDAPICCGRRSVILPALTVISKKPVYGCLICGKEADKRGRDNLPDSPHLI